MSQQRSGWAVGWIAFASVMMLVSGSFSVIAGLVGIIEDEFYVSGVGGVTENVDWVVELDATGWGWIHLIMGVIVLLAGLGVLTGNVLARTVGVFIAAISMIANFMWLPYYPVWSIVVIAIDVAVIWALTAHGRDVVEPKR